MLLNALFSKINLKGIMKDLPHHMKKLNRKVIRSQHREEELPDVPNWPDSKKEMKKKAKQAMKEEKEAHVPIDKTPDERNKEMRSGRVPVIEKNGAPPPHNPPSRKKRPRI